MPELFWRIFFAKGPSPPPLGILLPKWFFKPENHLLLSLLEVLLALFPSASFLLLFSSSSSQCAMIIALITHLSACLLGWAACCFCTLLPSYSHTHTKAAAAVAAAYFYVFHFSLSYSFQEKRDFPVISTQRRCLRLGSGLAGRREEEKKDETENEILAQLSTLVMHLCVPSFFNIYAR